MSELPQERLIVAVHAMGDDGARAELTIAYGKERQRSARRSSIPNHKFRCLAECKDRGDDRKGLSTTASDSIRAQARHRDRLPGPSTGSPTCSQESPTAACNCFGGMDIWTNYRSRRLYRRRAGDAHLLRERTRYEVLTPGIDDVNGH